MRFVTPIERVGDRVGLLGADNLVHAPPPRIRLIDLLDDPQRLNDAAQAAPRDPRAVHPYVSLRLRAPIPQPPTVRDFMTFEQHVEEVAGWANRPPGDAGEGCRRMTPSRPYSASPEKITRHGS
ncbi:hypothetical protein [Streptomyces sp. UG1]|uniref:hypothetical protein n=1 Tax=Streptomyces sp. UG1 TaxID=3417652 RepID=UPI003CEE1443